MSDMTPLCGFGMGDGGISAPTSQRSKQAVVPGEGATIQIQDNTMDGMTIMAPAAPLQHVTLILPAAGGDLQMHGIASMQDIASISFTGGTVLNAPMELLANQAVTIQRIDKTTSTWITI